MEGGHVKFYSYEKGWGAENVLGMPLGGGPKKGGGGYAVA